MDWNDLTTRLRGEAGALGFGLSGIAPATEADDFAHFEAWLDDGFGGEMAYLERSRPARRHPESLLPDVKTILMLGMEYGFTPDAQVDEPNSGRVARYARGVDYHDVIREKLKHLQRWLKQEAPESRSRGVVDTAPLLERDFARRAGLGWVGKNTLLINPKRGSFFFLAALLTDLPLPANEPFRADHCGSCTACMTACPTGAIVAPHRLDARKCISYLTIELRTPIPIEHREQMDDWLFGCDICQEVCPWNRFASPTASAALPRDESLATIDIEELLKLDEDGFHDRFAGTPMTRPKRVGMLRNAAVVLGNRGDSGSLAVLERLQEEADPMVREAAEWAIGRIRGAVGRREFVVTALPRSDKITRVALSMEREVMAPTLEQLGIDRLPVEERLEIMNALWDSLSHDREEAPLTEAQSKELDRRHALLQANPGRGAPWEVVHARLLERGKK